MLTLFSDENRRSRKALNSGSDMDFKTSIKLLVFGIFFIGLLMAILGFSGKQIDNVIQWFIPLCINFIISSFIGTIIEAYSGDSFKKISLTVPIWKFNFSISLFAILVVVIKLWLF
jgi:hypothetical protein